MYGLNELKMVLDGIFSVFHYLLPTAFLICALSTILRLMRRGLGLGVDECFLDDRAIEKEQRQKAREEAEAFAEEYYMHPWDIPHDDEEKLS